MREDGRPVRRRATAEPVNVTPHVEAFSFRLPASPRVGKNLDLESPRRRVARSLRTRSGIIRGGRKINRSGRIFSTAKVNEERTSDRVSTVWKTSIPLGSQISYKLARSRKFTIQREKCASYTSEWATRDSRLEFLLYKRFYHLVSGAQGSAHLRLEDLLSEPKRRVVLASGFIETEPDETTA